tara:strand:+ start:2990 stop:3331 length:342 start_codon:yes stop_codon:yes gene_type:complete
MKEFMMIFRNEKTDQPKPSPEQMQAMIKQWQDWIGGIAAQGKFVSTNALGSEGQTVNANGVVSDGPYAEVKEMVGGYIIVKAQNLADAVKLSEGCPTLLMGGKVEVRDIMVIN